MAKAPKKPEEQAPAAPAAAGGGKTKKMILFLIAVIVVAVLLVGIGFVGFLLGKKMSSGEGESEAEETSAQAPAASMALPAPVMVDPGKPPVYVALEQTFTANLKPDEGERRTSRFVLAKIQLQVADDPKWAPMLIERMPKVNDIINTILSSKSPSQIDKQELTEEIIAELNKMLGYNKPAEPTNMPWGPVIDVLFQQLVVQ